MRKMPKDDRKPVEPYEWFWSFLGVIVFVVLGFYTLITVSRS